MTAYTSSGSGKASAAGTWGGGGTPSSNGDTFTVSSGHLIEWDLDTSGLANGLGASTVNGTLYFSRTAGAYVLKMNGTLSITTTGTLDASDGSGGAYPSNCTATILLNGNFSIGVAGNGVVNLICGEPVVKYVKLTQNESIGATTLHVDSDVSADARWAGALIRIDDINQAAESEERTVSGSPTATTISITAGLTAAKSTGAYVILVSRNVKILGISAASGFGISGSLNAVLGAEIRLLGSAVATASSPVIGGTISNCGNGLNTCFTATVAVITGCTTGINNCNGPTLTLLLSGCTTGIGVSMTPTVTGIISGCTTGITTSQAAIVQGTISGCGTGISACGGVRLLSATLTGNARDMNTSVTGQAFNTLFGSVTEFQNYNSLNRQLYDYFESFDHDQVAGAYRAYTRGGITSSMSSPVYDASRARSYNAVCESASAYAFMQRQALVPAGGSLYVCCYARKDASMSYLPRIQVFSAEKEPLLSGSADAEVQMTNSTNTWEVLEATITNTTDAAKLYTVRMLAKNASGNVFFDPLIRTSAMLIPADMDGLLAA